MVQLQEHAMPEVCMIQCLCIVVIVIIFIHLENNNNKQRIIQAWGEILGSGWNILGVHWLRGSGAKPPEAGSISLHG